MKPFLNQQLTQSLLVELASGYYRKGDRFLSNREICRLWKVADTTAKRSLATLVAEGILQPYPRSGYRLSRNAPQMALLQLHKRKTPHLPPPSTWNTKRRQLRSVRSNRRPIAVIIDGAENPRSQPHHQIPPLVSSALICARAFSQAASLHRRQVLFYINNGASRIQNEIVESVLQGEIDGVAIFRRAYSHDLCSMTIPFLRGNLPVVTVFDDCQKTDAVSINVNNVGIGYDVAQRFLAQGHRRVAFLCGPTSSDTIRERLEGFRAALAESNHADLTLDILKVPASESSRSQTPASEIPPRTKAAILSLLRKPHRRPTAIFSSSVHYMVSLAPLLAQARCTVPHDISIISCGSSELVSPKVFPYDLMDFDFTAIGQLAFEQLSAVIEGIPVNRSQLINLSYCNRGTLQPPPIRQLLEIL